MSEERNLIVKIDNLFGCYIFLLFRIQTFLKETLNQLFNLFIHRIELAFTSHENQEQKKIILTEFSCCLIVVTYHGILQSKV